MLICRLVSKNLMLVQKTLEKMSATKIITTRMITTRMLPVKKIFYGLILLLSCALSLSGIAEASLHNKIIDTFPSLPRYERETKFSAVQKGFEERSNLFLKGKHFQNWSANRNQKDIFEEFKRIEEWRHQSWYSEKTGEFLVSRIDFMVAQDLLEKGFYRRPNLIAFQYNQTDGSYNSSNIVLNGQQFLALEGPTEKNLNQFYKLLQNFQVTQLVRLTPTVSNEEQKTYPYWQGRIQKGNKSESNFINIPLAGIRSTFPIRYYSMESWKDNDSIDPIDLSKLIQSVRKDSDPENGLLACHCVNGAGRTGTFIAGFALLQEIDRQIAAGVKLADLDISIEKIVMQLALQRVYMVSKPEQYLTLYRLVDSYIQHLQKKSQ